MSSFLERLEQDRDWISWVPGGDAEKYHTPDLLVGKLVDGTELDGDYGKTKIAILETEDGTRVGVWLNRTVLRNEFTQANPQWGETVGIKYLGEQLKKGGNPDKKTDHFQGYRVKVDRGIDNRPAANWGDSEVADVGVNLPVATQVPVAAASEPVAERAPADDDIPF